MCICTFENVSLSASEHEFPLYFRSQEKAPVHSSLRGFVNHSKKIRRYQRSPCQTFPPVAIHWAAGGRKPQGWCGYDFSLSVLIQFVSELCWCEASVWGQRNNPFINMGAIFFLPHIQAKLWMRCYLLTPRWTERCALFICSDRRDRRVGHGRRKTLKQEHSLTRMLPRIWALVHMQTQQSTFPSIILFSTCSKKMVHSRKHIGLISKTNWCFFWL